MGKAVKKIGSVAKVAFPVGYVANMGTKMIAQGKNPITGLAKDYNKTLTGGSGGGGGDGSAPFDYTRLDAELAGAKAAGGTDRQMILDQGRANTNATESVLSLIHI